MNQIDDGASASTIDPNAASRHFLLGSAFILCIAAAAKLWTITGDSAVLELVDPVLGTSFRILLLLAGALELGVALVCISCSAAHGLFALIWLSTAIFTYRFSLWWIGWLEPCSCLGNLTKALHISPQLADNIMKGLLAFMLVGSTSLLILHYRQGRAGGPSPNQPTLEAT